MTTTATDTALTTTLAREMGRLIAAIEDAQTPTTPAQQIAVHRARKLLVDNGLAGKGF